VWSSGVQHEKKKDYPVLKNKAGDDAQDVEGVKAYGFGKFDVSGEERHRPSAKYKYQTNFEGTGFYFFKGPGLDHAKKSGYIEKLSLVQAVRKGMSSADLQNFIRGYPALYLDVLRQGWPVQEYERENGIPVGALKDAFDRRLKEAIKRMDHMEGEPLELTEYFNQMSQADYDAFVRRGGTYLFYRNKKIKKPLVYLAPLGALGSPEDWAMKRAIAAEYGRLLRASLRNARAQSPQAQKKVRDHVNEVWDSIAIFSWEPQPEGAYPRADQTVPLCSSVNPSH
jgi:hypothetical protein